MYVIHDTVNVDVKVHTLCSINTITGPITEDKTMI